MASVYFKVRRLGVVTISALLLPVAQANAQQVTSDGTATDSALQEVVVTAQRRQESKQTTPVSLSAFTADELVASGIENTADLQKLTPGVVLNGAGNADNTTYTIRGQGKAVIGSGLPSVITYVNEVPLPSWGSSPPTFDIDNIQILKGPQGTSFGRNTTGGAVLVYTAQPTTDSFNGYVQAQGGNYRDAQFQGAVNIPVSDTFAVRIAADIDRRQGYTRDLTTGRDLDDEHSNAFRLSALFKPLDGLTNVLELDYIKYAENGVGVLAFQDLNPALLAPVLASQGSLADRTFSTSNAPSEQNTFWGLANTTTADLGIFTVKNIFGYRHTEVHQLIDDTGTDLAPLPNLGPPTNTLVTPGSPGIFTNTYFQRLDEQFSDELQFSGTALDRTLTWLFGAFYLEDRPDGPDSLALQTYTPVPPSALDTLVVNSVYKGAWPLSSLDDSLSTDQSRSVFVTSTYDLSQLAWFLRGLRLNAGFRYTWDNEGVCSNGRAVVALDGSALSPPYDSVDQCRADPTAYSSSVSFSAPTHTLGLDYTVNDDVFIYFTNRTGYRAGGLNTPALAPLLQEFQSYGPQKVTDYEIGLHTKWHKGSWVGRFNVDAYQDKYSDLQLQATGIFPGSLPGVTAQNAPSNTALTLNAGRATFQGVEFDGLLSPFSGLSFNFGAAYLNARYDSFSVAPVMLPFFSAAHFTGAPQWSCQGELRYTLPFHPSPGGRLALTADYYHIDSEYQGFARLPGYELTDFTAVWSGIAGKGLDLTVFVNNAFNTTYVQNVSLSEPTFGLFSGNYGPPRLFGARVRYSFGK